MLRIGEFSAQSIFPIAVGVGLMHNAERARYAKIAKGKLHRKKLEDLGYDTKIKVNAMLKAIAATFDVMLLTVENVLCEITRTRMQDDIYFRGHTLHNVIKDGMRWTLV